MKRLIVLLLALTTLAFAQLIDVHFGDTQVNDLTVDSVTVLNDTLAIGTDAPEYFFHLKDDGVYSLFEGNNDGKTYVAVDNNHATHEVGFSIWRLGTEMWTIEDSNGTFIIFDADDVANRVTIDGSTGNVVIHQSLGVTGHVTADSIAATVNATGGITSANFIIAVGDTISVLNGIVTKLEH